MENLKPIYVGYEGVWDKLKEYTPEKYLPLNDEDKAKMVEEVFEIYRSINIFPEGFYTEDGIRNEILKCANREIVYNGEDILNVKNTQGTTLCKHFFPNIWNARYHRNTTRPARERFFLDNKLRKAIKIALKIQKNCTPPELRKMIEMDGQCVTNFLPMRAKAIIEYFTPENGVYYDSSAGYGGRMIATMSSKKNIKYIGVDPCTETFDNLNTFGNKIEEVLNKKDSFEVYKTGSEEFFIGDNTIDFSFTSPPYFNLEIYTDEDTQCYNKFDNFGMWLEGFVRPTIKNIYRMLKDGCYYAVNIKDFKDLKICDNWIQIAEEEGFTFERVIEMKIQTRVGIHGKKPARGDETRRAEGIYLFKK